MTQRVNPSPGRPTDTIKTATALDRATTGGGPTDGYVLTAPTRAATEDANIDETALNAFDETHSSSSPDVTIDAGEAFISGSWVCIDTSTTITLSTSTTGQTVGVGWDPTAPDTVRVDTLTALSNDGYITHELWTFDTDSSGVTAVTDERRLDYTLDVDGDLYIGGNEQTTVSNDGTGARVSGDPLRLDTDLESVTAGTIWDQSDGGIVASAVNLGRGLETDGSGNIQFDEDVDYTFSKAITVTDTIFGQTFSAVDGIYNGFNGGELTVDDTTTSLTDPNHDTRFEADGSTTALVADDTTPVTIRDSVQAGTAVEYTAGTAGTVALSGAKLDLAPAGENLRLGTEQSIEDGSGKSRISLDSSRTLLHDDAGQHALFADSGKLYGWNVYSGEPWALSDKEQGQTAVQYTPDPTTGTLELPNANLDLSQNNLSGVSKLTLADGTSGGGVLQSFADGNGEGALNIVSAHGPETIIGTHHRLIGQDDAGNTTTLLETRSSGDVKIPNGNLLLLTGQSITDGSGTSRVEFLSSNTNIFDDGSNPVLSGRAGGYNRIFAHSDQPIVFRDGEGGFNAVKYNTDPTTGTLELSNADLDVGGDVFVSNQRPLIELDGSLDNQFALRTWVGSNYKWSHEIDSNGNTINIKNLTRGKGRLVINADGPAILRDEAGRTAFSASQEFGNLLKAYSDTNVRIEDNAFGTSAVKYISSATAPGTFELTNAKLNMTKNRISFQGTGSQSTPTSAITWPDQGGGSDPTLTVSGGGEIVAYDDDGNQTQLT